MNKIAKIRRNSFSFTSLGIAAVAVFMGLLPSLFTSHRQYFPTKISAKEADNAEMGDAKGMAQFFFNARKNITTNSMDYPAMLAADIADRAMLNTRKTHAPTTLPAFNWMSMGPTNVGGRTRAILIDNSDPTHQTIFAGGVSGGIWKSTNGGGTWDNASDAISYSLNDTLSNINVSCIAQDKNGVIYIGTGEGFSIYSQGEGFTTGLLGGGIFKSTDHGATWRLLKSTQPTANADNVTWSYVNRIAIRPDNPNVIYAATQGGLMISHDSGATWNSAFKSGSSLTKLSGNSFNALDVKISNDGSIVVACIGAPVVGSEPSTVGCYGYYCYPQSATTDSVFTEIPSSGHGHLNGNAGRIEFAISPTDPNRIYASVIAPSPTIDPFQANTLSGIFMTMTAKTNGGYWYEIGPGGTLSFDPYAEPGGGDDQAYYDNTLGVPPANEAQVLCGGTTFWEWSGSTLSDTVGSWHQIGYYDYPVHADLHTIVFDTNNPETVYIGCDGGIYKCSNMYINPAYPTGSIANLSIQPANRNYNVTQYYTVCYSPEVTYVNVNDNNTTTLQGLGLGGGTQDNGTPYVNGTAFGGYPNDGYPVSGGDGAGCAISQLDPNIAYFCADYGALEREGNLGTLSPVTSAYTESRGYDEGGNIDSIYALGGACFVMPVALYENPYDTLNRDSILYTADSNYAAGHTVWPISANANFIYPYVLPKAIDKDSSMMVPDRVVSRLAIGFAGEQGGIWINGQGASNNTVVWMPIAGPLSKPDAFTTSARSGDYRGMVHALAWTPDGNTLFAGCEDGVFFRFSNINSIIANSYKSGALWSNSGSRGIVDTSNQVVSTNLGNTFSGRDILSISVDQNNANNVLITLGNYGETDYVYYSSNALDTSAAPTFTAVQGNLPKMPVYSSILDILDSTGHWIPNSAMIGTEHGIYTTTNINGGGGTVWTKNNKGMANCLTLAVKQQITEPWLCNNAGVIYVGSHGRGLWATNNEYQKPTAVPTIAKSATALNNLLVYPNPMTTEGNISFNLAAADNITIAIYDMQGNQIKTINMGNQSPGSHLVTFASSGLRGGIYFASLTGNNFRKVTKFVVVQ